MNLKLSLLSQLIIWIFDILQCIGAVPNRQLCVHLQQEVNAYCLSHYYCLLFNIFQYVLTGLCYTVPTNQAIHGRSAWMKPLQRYIWYIKTSHIQLHPWVMRRGFFDTFKKDPVVSLTPLSRTPWWRWHLWVGPRGGVDTYQSDPAVSFSVKWLLVSFKRIIRQKGLLSVLIIWVWIPASRRVCLTHKAKNGKFKHLFKLLTHLEK